MAGYLLSQVAVFSSKESKQILTFTVNYGV